MREEPEGAERPGADLCDARPHQSTPTFVINGKQMLGEQTMEQLDTVIQPLLKKK